MPDPVSEACDRLNAIRWARDNGVKICPSALAQGYYGQEPFAHFKPGVARIVCDPSTGHQITHLKGGDWKQ